MALTSMVDTVGLMDLTTKNASLSWGKALDRGSLSAVAQFRTTSGAYRSRIAHKSPAETFSQRVVVTRGHHIFAIPATYSLRMALPPYQGSVLPHSPP